MDTENSDHLLTVEDVIFSMWPLEGKVPSLELLTYVDEQIILHPSSSRLHQLQGELFVLLSDNDQESDNNKDDALASYLMSLLLDSQNADIYVDLGYLFDVYWDRQALASVAFQKALDLNPSCVDAVLGLARSYAQRGQPIKAIDLIRDNVQLDEEKLLNMMKEIQDGIWTP